MSRFRYHNQKLYFCWECGVEVKEPDEHAGHFYKIDHYYVGYPGRAKTTRTHITCVKPAPRGSHRPQGEFYGYHISNSQGASMRLPSHLGNYIGA